jgi:alpha-1,3-rhamnosyl/mannosyltransferase
MSAPDLVVGIDVGKALGEADGLATVTRVLVQGLAGAEVDHRFVLFDLHHRELDEPRLRQVFPELPDRFTVAAGAPRAGVVDVFHAPAHRCPPTGTGRLVYTLHDLTYISHPRLHTAANRADTLVATAEAACQEACFVAVSRHTRQQAVDLLALPPEWVEVVHNAPDPVFRPLDRHRVVTVLDRLDIDRPYVLTVGSLEPRKNLVGLLDAFERLPDAVRGSHALVVTGAAGWHNREILERLDRAARHATIVRTGAVALEDLVALYGGAAAFAYPSLAEGFGLPVVEAMACGAPVVTSSCSALPEVAGEAALLVEPTDPAALADGLGRILTDDDLSRELRARGLARARELTLQRMADRLLEIYQRLG